MYFGDAHDFHIRPLLFLESAVNELGDILFGTWGPTQEASHVHM
jgi:hypothetical protein